MAGYTPLFQSIVMSSIWNEDSDTCKVWVTLLALADANGQVEGSVIGLANSARVSTETCLKALEKLQSPDLFSRTKDDEGRRIREIEGGWFVINHKKYRNKAKSRAEYMRKWREEKKKNQKEKKETQTLNTNTNSVTESNTRVTGVTVTQFAIPPEKQRWNDIAFQVGLTDTEAENAYDHFDANGWKRGNGVAIESWQQVPGLLRYWRNNRQNFAGKEEKKSGKRIQQIYNKYCTSNKTPNGKRCRLPAVHHTQNDFGGDIFSCWQHAPEEFKSRMIEEGYSPDA